MHQNQAPHRPPRILVLGSLNIDLVQHVPRLPAVGETLPGGELALHVGGKGANQACAAGILGGSAGMAGAVGDDPFGARLLKALSDAHVDVTQISTSSTASGTALIFILPDGNNSIVISPGANGTVSPSMARSAAAQLRAGDILLCQLEIPLASVQAGLTAARANGATTILDPAPAAELSDEMLAAVSILTPNQTEASLLCGTSQVGTLTEAEAAARQLQKRGPGIVIVKLGADGCLLFDGTQAAHVPTFPVKAVDTTAAGDTFNGAFAVALQSGASLLSAARFANAAAALSVTRPGAIASIPSRQDVEQLLKGPHVHRS